MSALFAKHCRDLSYTLMTTVFLMNLSVSINLVPSQEDVISYQCSHMVTPKDGVSG